MPFTNELVSIVKIEEADNRQQLLENLTKAEKSAVLACKKALIKFFKVPL